MSAADLGPLDWRIAITDGKGRPTPEFQRRWATQRGNNALIGSVGLGSGAPPATPVPDDGAEYIDTSTTPNTLYVGFGGVWKQVGAVKFTQLIDAPSSYTSKAGSIVRVNSGATGLEFDTLTAVLDSLGSTQGDILYRSASGWVVLTPGTAGFVLSTGGTGANPSWVAQSGGGGTPGGTSGQVQYNNNGAFGGFTVGGDATLTVSTGSLIVTKTNGVSFAASATTDTTNAANISSGVLGSSRGGAGSVSGLLKANGSGVVSAATAGTDYAAATSGSSILSGNGSGGFTNITVGSTLSFSGGTLNVASSVALAGSPTTTTQTAGDSSTKIATTAFVTGATRPKLTANTTLFVATTGSDSNNGLTSGTPFLTIQKGVDTAFLYDWNGFQMSIQCAAGTYAGQVLVSGKPTGQTSLGLRIVGDTTTPANCVLSFAGSGATVMIQYGAIVNVLGFKFTPGSTTDCLYASETSVLSYNSNEFAGSGQYHVRAGGSAVCQANGAYKISGGALAHWRAELLGRIYCNGQTVTITGTPAFGVAFAMAPAGMLVVIGTTFSGSATGIRYAMSFNSAISVNGAATTYFPGNVAGTNTDGSGIYA